MVEAYGHDAEPSSYLIVCVFTCRPVAAGDEIVWNYGEGYDELRQHAGYAAGGACPEEIIDRMTVTLPLQNARVEAILARGGARAHRRRFTSSQTAVRKTRAGTSGSRCEEGGASTAQGLNQGVSVTARSGESSSCFVVGAAHVRFLDLILLFRRKPSTLLTIWSCTQDIVG